MALTDHNAEENRAPDWSSARTGSLFIDISEDVPPSFRECCEDDL